MNQRDKLPPDFFRGTDVVRLARSILGKRLFTCIDAPVPGLPPERCLTGGVIVETEAYAGARDRASHAFGNRRTSRTEVMFREGGTAYVYLCYGIHCLFNIVTNVEGVPHAVLIRAIEPTHGIEIMLARRKKERLDRSLTAGPGSLCRALGIGLRHSGESVAGSEIWLEIAPDLPSSAVEAGPRVGVDYAGRDARRPWRFSIRGSSWISRSP